MAMTRKQRGQLGVFIAQKRRARREQERAARRAKRTTSLELEVYEPIGFHFNPRRHDLTLEQCRTATDLLRRRNRESPIRGTSKQAQFRRALRIAGIVSAVKGGRVGNSHFGYSLHGHRGGGVTARHGPHILAENRRRIQERRQFEKVWERQQSQPQSYEDWQQAIVEWPVQQYSRDFMAY